MKYRIVRDGYSGFEVQGKPWWWPFYTQLFVGTNTHATIEKARSFIDAKANKFVEHYNPPPKSP